MSPPSQSHPLRPRRARHSSKPLVSPQCYWSSASGFPEDTCRLQRVSVQDCNDTCGCLSMLSSGAAQAATSSRSPATQELLDYPVVSTLGTSFLFCFTYCSAQLTTAFPECLTWSNTGLVIALFLVRLVAQKVLFKVQHHPKIESYLRWRA